MRKLIQTVACATAISLCLFGCGNQDSQEPATNPENIVVVSTDTEPTEAITQQITMDICENVSMDAEVKIPGKTQYSTYTLNMVDCAPDRLFGIFCPEGYGSYTQKNHNEAGYVEYLENSGKKLVVYGLDYGISYWSYDIDTGNNSLQEVESLLYYYTQEHPQAQNHDLSFMTVSEMEAYGKSILSQLGVVLEPELHTCVTLSGQEILDFQQEMYQTSYYTEFQTPEKLASAEDTCYMVFSFTYDGVPVFGPEALGVSFMDGVFPPVEVEATIVLNADGIQSFRVTCPCNAVVTSEAQAILTPEEAIAALQEKYELEIVFGAIKIVDMWLEYIPIQHGQTTVLTPYWCFAQKMLIEYDDGTSIWSENGSAERINAITGEDLAYGG